MEMKVAEVVSDEVQAFEAETAADSTEGEEVPEGSAASSTSFCPSSTLTRSRYSPSTAELSAPLPLLRDSLRLLTSHGLSARDAARVFSTFPSPPDEPLRFLSADAPPPRRAAVVRSPRLLAASVPDTLRPALLFLRSRVALLRELLPLAAALLLAFSVERTLLPKLLFLRDATGLPDPAVCIRQRPSLLSQFISRQPRKRPAHRAEPVHFTPTTLPFPPPPPPPAHPLSPKP
ncbi:hypothetical protein BAE44_0016755 [Dichanthelium oligosanthes]|uniref:Uncharacterized protein n=1 Tax=Dichanthelium oligosanthes TaxID=888268 RepID=A0A1E5VAP8_9POAL|nr:hypothetical protein BAE44_0016755 [Dichanthelium oligosanthes]